MIRKLFGRIFRKLRMLWQWVCGRGWKPDRMAMSGVIVAVLDGPGGRRVHRTHNIVTTAGDVFCAQKIAGETPTNAFANLELGSKAVPTTSKASTTSSITKINNTEKPPSVGYPKANDSDPDNTEGGTNVTTWKYAYGKADFNAPSITEGIIKVASAGDGQPVLCHFAFASAFEKTANDTLTVFYNLESKGV